MGPPKTILIVEDESSVFDIIRRQLEPAGYAVLGEATGKGAIEYIQHAKPLLVLLDLGLPDMDGFAVITQIKKIQPDLPVIIVTGSHREDEARRAFDLGAFDYITKPIDFTYLKNILLFQNR